jgi:hypothetical protein
MIPVTYGFTIISLRSLVFHLLEMNQLVNLVNSVPVRAGTLYIIKAKY